MEELVFATHNKHKLQEMRQIIGSLFHIISLDEIGCNEEIEETQSTIEGNALQKARYVAEKYHKNCFADDTGLEIEALNGEPGVYSARYAGEHATFDDNMNKTLANMQGMKNRNACFRTAIALILDGKEYIFEGRVDGEILTEKHGTEGFGYDPIFRPEGFAETFAEMSAETKNSISHRGRATEKLVEFLSRLEK